MTALYYAVAYNTYYPRGGFHDIKGVHTSEHDARHQLETLDYHYHDRRDIWTVQDGQPAILRVLNPIGEWDDPNPAIDEWEGNYD